MLRRDEQTACSAKMLRVQGSREVATLKNDDLLPKTMQDQHTEQHNDIGSAYRRSRLRKFPKWYRIPRLLPGELPGSLHREYRTCSKKNCRCRSGRQADLHGPYWVHRWRGEEGRQQKRYVKQADLEAVEAAIERRKARLRQQRAERNRHMRRGMGHGLAAHEWARARRSEPEPAKLDQLRAILRSVSGGGR